MKFMNLKKISVGMLAGVVFVVPFVGLAQIGIPCTGVGAGAGGECGFNDLIILADNIIKFLVFKVSVPLAALGFMVLGVQVLLHPNESEARSNIKETAGTIAKGIGIILAAFLLVKMVLFAFLDTGAGFTAWILQ